MKYAIVRSKITIRFSIMSIKNLMKIQVLSNEEIAVKDVVDDQENHYQYQIKITTINNYKPFRYFFYTNTL